MVQIISGLFIVCFGLLGFSVEIENFLITGFLDPFGVVFSFVILMTGACLVYFKYSTRKKTNNVLNEALSMYRHNIEINTMVISNKVGLSEIDVRRIIKKAQEDGLFPIYADMA
ncbi:hypothetical protein [Desulfoluna spongiiphila]|uniref:hypothetical protein n=1 Tax=Desulfoluna spongiiphila TaxID=419481 RepID=UPI001255DE70|nr:hypothetical protein [Desulfoluna spongiiphila]VVS90983.1 hypothetical protein DBB_5510 [Desulfoluna spongiiphila]